MSTNYIILACLALVLYFYTIQNNQIRSTASAIRSVFTGECRLACRQSQVSGVSGMSSLHGAGPSRNLDRIGPHCVCESCPCPVIARFLRTCSPATRMYTTFIAMVSQIYCSIIASIVGTTSFDSNENFGFKDLDKEDVERFDKVEKVDNTDKFTPVAKNRSLTALKEKILSVTSMISTKSTGVSFPGYGNKKKQKMEAEASTSTSDATEPEASKASQSVATSSSIGSCPKCVDKGKTCLRECPQAKK